MTATVNAYIKLHGNAKEAMDFYKNVFNGEFLAVLRYGDEPAQLDKMSTEDQRKIAFMTLNIGHGTTLMASDVIGSNAEHLRDGNNVYIYINVESEQELDGIFAKLKRGGRVLNEPTNTPWGGYYCELVDAYGISWIINFQRDLGPLSHRPRP